MLNVIKKLKTVTYFWEFQFSSDNLIPKKDKDCINNISLAS